MANKKNSGYSTAKKANKGLVAALLSAAVFLAAAGGVTGVFAYGTKGFTDWSFSRFAPKAQPEKVQPKQLSGGVILADDGESNDRIALACSAVERADFATYGADRSAVSVHVFEATFTPAETTATACDWSIKYKDGTEVPETVMTITPDSDGSTRATLTCLTAFEKQIKLTCTSRFYDVSVTKSVDYLGEPYYDGDLNLIYLTGRVYGDEISIPGYTEYSGTSFYTEGGTIAPDGMLGYVEYELSNGLYTYLTQRGWNLKKTVTESNKCPVGMEVNGIDDNTINWNIEKFTTNTLSESEYARLRSDYKRYCLSLGSEYMVGQEAHPTVKYVATLYYKGEAHREITTYIPICTEEQDLTDFFADVPTVNYSINGVQDVVFG